MIDTLWQSFANANVAVVEMEAVRAAIRTAVSEGALGAIRSSDEEWKYDAWSGEEDWVYSYAIQSVRLRETGPRGASRGTLSVAISFYRPEDRAGDDWAGARRAKLYVGIAPTLKAWDVDTLLVDGSGRSEVAEPMSPFRWRRSGTPDAWFFCVELDRIDGREALLREIMRPLAALLSRSSEEEAFAGCEALLRTDTRRPC